MIDKIQGYYGFTAMPFGKDLAPGMLHRLGVITGEVGAGKTVAVRAALDALDHPRHTVIYLPNPAVGVAGIHQAIVTRLGGVPKPHRSTLIPQAADALATEHAERGRVPVLVID